jgi:hypothetical protein
MAGKGVGKTKNIGNPSEELEQNVFNGKHKKIGNSFIDAMLNIDSEEEPVKSKYFFFKNSTQCISIREVESFSVYSEDSEMGERFVINITNGYSNTIISYDSEKVRNTEYQFFVEWLEENDLEFENKTL